MDPYFEWAIHGLFAQSSMLEVRIGQSMDYPPYPQIESWEIHGLPKVWIKYNDYTVYYNTIA